MTTTITPACERDCQVVDFVKTQRAAAQPAAAPDLFCANVPAAVENGRNWKSKLKIAGEVRDWAILFGRNNLSCSSTTAPESRPSLAPSRRKHHTFGCCRRRSERHTGCQ